jgi:hypothetical protein
MKIGFPALLITATLLITLAFPAAAAAPAPTPGPHPHIDEGIESMRAAKHHLEMAEHDFDGHRAKAIEHLNMAIHEAEICASMR